MAHKKSYINRSTIDAINNLASSKIKNTKCYDPVRGRMKPGDELLIMLTPFDHENQENSKTYPQ